MTPTNGSSAPPIIHTIAAEVLNSPELAPAQEPTTSGEAEFHLLARRTGNFCIAQNYSPMRIDALSVLAEASLNVLSSDRTLALQKGSVTVEIDGGIAYLNCPYSGQSRLLVASGSHERAADLFADLIETLRHADDLAPDEIELRFWFGGSEGRAHFQLKRAAVRNVSEVSDVLSTSAASALSQLADDGWKRGGIHVWHGPPGCGKTTAIQALAHAWRDHLVPDVVLDPEIMLSGTQYLMRVLASPNSPRLKSLKVTVPRRLIVLEDAGEFVGIDAREQTGSGISRLLNMSDGMFGNGRTPIVIITTNEPVAMLHPAILRPGRCRSVVEFGPVPKAQAQAWLAKQGHVAGNSPNRDMSIAELAALAELSAPVIETSSHKVGFDT